MNRINVGFCLAACLALLLSFAAGVQADDTDGVARLNDFLADSDSFTVRFEQTLYDADSVALQNSRGTLKLKRPGRFVWDYEEPAGQRLVADGELLWMLDSELEQVTVNRMERMMSGSPFAVLMGNESLEEAFEVASLGNADGIDWLSMKPRAEDSDFEEVFLGLNDEGLAAMELRDSLGQATQIRFSEFDSETDIDDAEFVFDIPEGHDVIGLEETAEQ